MINKRFLFLIVIVALVCGYLLALRNYNLSTKKSGTIFNKLNVAVGDNLVFSIKGNIYEISSSGMVQITHDQNLIDPLKYGNFYLAVKKNLNYSSILKFDPKGR